PLWAIFASYALMEMHKRLPAATTAAGFALRSLAGVGIAAAMLWFPVINTTLSPTPLLQEQKNFTNSFVATIDRNEPVAVLWSQCAGYMFNPHVGYHWVAMPHVSEITHAISGEHPHGQNFIEEMESRQVRYVVGMENYMLEGLSDEALTYLRTNFEWSHCLWTRKQQ
ncbi:MAG: hypothetical protein ACR2P6_01610, partial [Gammaproteobacteria bacterium]